MKDEEIERVLGGEEDVLPSSGFHASVMEAIHREVTVPPIPFPWHRALPAFAAAALAVLVSTVLLLRSGVASFDALLAAERNFGAAWLALAALVTTGSLLLSRRLCE
jgi:hypothetical protein